MDCLTFYVACSPGYNCFLVRILVPDQKRLHLCSLFVVKLYKCSDTCIVSLYIDIILLDCRTQYILMQAENYHKHRGMRGGV